MSGALWHPTHQIPEGGLMARAEPNAALEPLQRIRAGTAVSVVEQHGGWSKIRTEQGWEAWLDGTRLEAVVPAAAPSAAPPPPPPPPPPPVPQAVVTPSPAPVAAPAVMAGWAATHIVPEGGLPARERPDASMEPLLRIRSGTGVRVLEEAGAWSRVDIESGWSAWLDNRRLEAVGGATPVVAAEPAAPVPAAPEPQAAPAAASIAASPEAGDPETATETETAAFSPTHSVAEKGAPTRDRPDPKVKASGRLEGGTAVEETAIEGAWSRVRNGAGDEFWVARRLLSVLGEGTAAEPAPGDAGPGEPATAEAEVGVRDATPDPEPVEAPPAAAGWAATHTVPEGGLPARERPDASLEPLLRIRSGTGVRVLEEAGAWSRVGIESGWSAWLDNRRLEAVGGEPSAASAPAVPAPGPQAAPEPWRATHTVPDGGLSAWAEPRADRQPILKIKSGTGVAVVEERGGWARIRTDSGWEAWVDGRRLVPAA